MFVKRRRRKEEDGVKAVHRVCKHHQGREGIIPTTDTREGTIPYLLILVLYMQKILILLLKGNYRSEFPKSPSKKNQCTYRHPSISFLSPLH